jgi:hypothetical protein
MAKGYVIGFRGYTPTPGDSAYEKQVVVRQASDFDVPLKDGFNYFLDGVVDLTGSGVSLQLVSDGISSISGYDFRTSGIICDDDNYTLFVNDGASAGRLIINNFYIQTGGTGSQVYDIEADTGTEEIVTQNLLYLNCNSLGTISGYAQALEQDTYRVGGTPEMTLDGAWSSGYFIDNSLGSQLTDGSYFIYKAGRNFSMASRFRSNQNIDLRSNIGFLDFEKSNFTNDNLLQLTDCIISRNGSFDPEDSTILPNISAAAAETLFTNCVGIKNTYAGGKITVSTEAPTSITQVSTFEQLAGTFTSSDLQHFSASSDPTIPTLTNDASNPTEFTISLDLTLESRPNDVVEIRFKKTNAMGVVTTFGNQARQVNSLVGGRDVAFFNTTENVILNEVESLTIEVTNNSTINDVTAEVGSSMLINQR